MPTLGPQTKQPILVVSCCVLGANLKKELNQCLSCILDLPADNELRVKLEKFRSVLEDFADQPEPEIRKPLLELHTLLLPRLVAATEPSEIDPIIEKARAAVPKLQTGAFCFSHTCLGQTKVGECKLVRAQARAVAAELRKAVKEEQQL